MDADQRLEIEVRRAVYWIRKAADDRGLNLDQLAVFSGLSRSSILQMGKNRQPTLRTLAAVAAYLDCEVADLLRPVPSEGGS